MYFKVSIHLQKAARCSIMSYFVQPADQSHPGRGAEAPTIFQLCTFFATFGGNRMRKPANIVPPKGKLGVLMPGMGAVSTTLLGGGGLGGGGGLRPLGSL